METVAVHIESIAHGVHFDKDKDDQHQAVAVRSTPECRTGFSTVNVPANAPTLILAASHKRRRTSLTIVGQSSDVVYVCGSESDAAANHGAIAMGLQVVEFVGSGDVWVQSATAVAVGVFADYES